MDENPHRTDEHALSEKQTNTDDSKLATLTAAVTDSKFPLPVLNDQSSTLRYILSFGTLASFLAGGIVGAWFLDVTMLQSQQPVVVLSLAFFGILGALFFTGTVWIDWFELVLGYWWLSMPIGAAAGLVLVMKQEQDTGIRESTKDQGELVARYYFVAVDGYDEESSRWIPTYLDVSTYGDDEFVKLRLRTQHDIVKWNLQQRLRGSPAPLSPVSQMVVGTAHVVVNDWEAKDVWDGRFSEEIHDLSFGELLQINHNMDLEGFDGISIAQGHQGERTYRDPERPKRDDIVSAELSFTTTKDDNGKSFAAFFVNNYPPEIEKMGYCEFRQWAIYAKKRPGTNKERRRTTRALLTTSETMRLHSEVFGCEPGEYEPEEYLELMSDYDDEIRNV